jgi:hypothetical protein
MEVPDGFSNVQRKKIPACSKQAQEKFSLRKL